MVQKRLYNTSEHPLALLAHSFAVFLHIPMEMRAVMPNSTLVGSNMNQGLLVTRFHLSKIEP